MVMRLLQILPSTYRGGSEEYALRIARGVSNLGFDVHTAFMKTEGTMSLISDFKSSSIQYHQLDIGRGELPESTTRIQLFKQFINTVLLLARVRPHVVHLSLPSIYNGFSTLLACALFRIPMVVVFHLAIEEFHFSRRRLNAYLWAKAAKQRWVTISNSNRQVISKTFKISEDAIDIIYNGTDTHVSSMTSEEKERMRRLVRNEFSLASDDKLLITVGGLRSQKGYEYLLPAIPDVMKDFPKTRWLWVGDGEFKEYLTQKIAEAKLQDFIKLVGYRTDVSKLLCAADLFIFPTRFEGRSFALLEAMAAGLPIVTTNAIGIPEIITHMEHGILCKKENSAALTEGIKFALTHPDKMKQFAANARDRVQQFSNDAMITNTLQLFKEVVTQ
jgi:glycosyltransferase involved in cell wall biosynthesis